jgi:Glycosyl hydrolase family 79 C-terminal beta domain
VLELPQPGSLAGVAVDRDAVGPRIPESFLGFSQEYPIVLAQVGSPERGTNPVLVALYRNLARFGSGMPALRVGGATTDATWYDPSRGPRPSGISYTVTSRWLDGVRGFLGVTHAPAIIGVNLGLNRTKVATDWARAVSAGLPSRPPVVFELGNEPDAYDINPAGLTPGAPTIRPKPYGVSAYVRDANRFTRALRRLSPPPLIAGPALACRRDCTLELPEILASGGPGFALATVHRYPLTACPDGATPATIPSLLSPRASRQSLRVIRLLAQEATRARVPLRVTETNSVACGGRAGVSNVFASALWGADWLFGLQAAGATGADVHSGSPLYAPFVTRPLGGQYVASIKPLYYGMLLFAEATAHRSAPLRAGVTAGEGGRRANVKAWAFYDAQQHVVRVAVINKALAARGTVRVRVPGATGAGAVKRLLAPGPAAPAGITWGGQHFAFPTRDGRLIGPRRIERVARSGSGDFTFRLPAASAALLTVPVPSD